MSDRVLCLAGPGVGPWVCVASITKPIAKVVGVGDGVMKVFGSILGRNADQVLVTEITEPGLHSLSYWPFIRIEYNGKAKAAMLTLHQGRKDAVQSDLSNDS